MMSTDNPNENTKSEPSAVCDRWLRDTTGTYEVVYKSGKLGQNRIANQLVKIVQILFVLAGTKPSIEYWVEFAAASHSVNIRISHEDLSDEKRFLCSAPAGFSLASGYGKFSLLRECLMADLPQASRAAVLTTLGWYLWRGEPIFAYAGGICSETPFINKDDEMEVGTSELLDLIDIDAVCSDVPILAGHYKPVSEILVEVPPQFAKYKLPKLSTKEAACVSVRHVIDLLNCDVPAIYVGVAAAFATAIHDPRYAIFLYGESGSMKTAFALILLSFFVPNASEKDCVSFTSTTNAMRGYSVASGNVAVVYDDFVPRNGYKQTSEEVKKVDDFLRSTVNGTGKDRCGSDGRLRSSPRPRGLAILTGEQLPEGCESLKWRTVNIQVDKTTFADLTTGGRPNQFDTLQAFASQGEYAKAMHFFVGFLAGRLNYARTQLDDWALAFELVVHRRLTDSTGELLSSMRIFLDAALEIGACSEAEADSIFDRTSFALYGILMQASLESLEDSPVERFFTLLRECMISKKCHLEIERPDLHNIQDNFVPICLLGYSEFEVEKNSKQCNDEDGDESDHSDYRTIYKAHGTRIGSVCSGNTVDIIPSAALEAANNLAKNCGISPIPSTKVLGKMLAAKGYLVKQQSDRNTYKVRLGKVVIDVWRMDILHLFEFVLEGSEFDIACLEGLNEEERRARRNAFIDAARASLNKSFERTYEKMLNPYLDSSSESTQLKPPPLPGNAPGKIAAKPRALKPPYVQGISEYNPQEDLEA